MKLCSDLRFGARLGYDGPRQSKFSKNLKSSIDNPTIVSDNLAKEVALGHTAGPFTNPPFANLQVSSIGIVPKKHSDKFRTIFHLSFPKTGESINSFIEMDDFPLQYIEIDDAIAALIRLGRGTYLAKTDIESAFRQFPVHPEDWELLGMYRNNSYYFDKLLRFGLRSAPYIFNQLSDALEWILLNKCFISYVGHILDDFLIMEPPTLAGLPSQAWQTSLSSMLLTFNTLGVPIAEHKTEGPSLIIEFLGIILDSEDGGSPPTRQIESSIYRARCLAYKKVSYTPRAPIPNRNTKFCMQSHPSGSSFSATHHKSNTGGFQTASSHSLD